MPLSTSRPFLYSSCNLARNRRGGRWTPARRSSGGRGRRDPQVHTTTLRFLFFGDCFLKSQI